MCTALVAMSLVPLIGWAGQVSLAPLAFAGHRRGRVHAPRRRTRQRLRGHPRRRSSCVPVGALLALPALRLQGLYLALGHARRSRRWWSSCSSSSRSRSAPRAGRPGASQLFGMHFDGTRTFLLLVTAVFGIVGVGMVALRRSAFGRRLIALRDSEAAAATIGVNVLETKVAVFMLSAAMAGFAGRVPRAVLRDDQPGAVHDARRPADRARARDRRRRRRSSGALFAGVFGLGLDHHPGDVAPHAVPRDRVPRARPRRARHHPEPVGRGRADRRGLRAAAAVAQGRQGRSRRDEGRARRSGGRRARPRPAVHRGRRDHPRPRPRDHQRHPATDARRRGREADRDGRSSRSTTISVVVRRPARTRPRVARRRGRAGHRADRPERRGQDHALQRHHRAADTRRRAWSASTGATSRAPSATPAPGSASRARSSASSRSAASPRARTCSSRSRCAGAGPPRSTTPATVADELLEQVGISAVADRKVDSLPTGTARLVELARALGTAPRVLLLDEPSSGLDEDETDALGRLLLELAGATASASCSSSTTCRS